MFCHKHFSDKFLLVVRTLSWLQYFSIVLSIQTGYNKNPIMWFFMGLRKENIMKRKMIKGRYIAPWRLSSGAFSAAPWGGAELGALESPFWRHRVSGGRRCPELAGAAESSPLWHRHSRLRCCSASTPFSSKGCPLRRNKRWGCFWH